MHDVFVTVDVDWAPDWAMRQLLHDLLEAGVRSTWFITHPTEVLAELRSRPDLVDLGIHPNFLPGSSHGGTVDDVLRSCMELVPEARTMRTHCLVQSTPILQAVVDSTPIALDVSIYLRNALGTRPSMLPLNHARGIARAAYVWEDDLEFFASDPSWDARRFLEPRLGVDSYTIIDVHPIHYALNSSGIEKYQALKQAVGDMRLATQEAAEPFVGKGPGTATFIRELISSDLGARVEFETALLTLADERQRR